jgi:hypothetical protein
MDADDAVAVVECHDPPGRVPLALGSGQWPVFEERDLPVVG